MTVAWVDDGPNARATVSGVRVVICFERRWNTSEELCAYFDGQDWGQRFRSLTEAKAMCEAEAKLRARREGSEQL